MSPVFTWTTLCQQVAELSGSATRKQIIACMSVSELLIDCCVVVLVDIVDETINEEFGLSLPDSGKISMKTRNHNEKMFSQKSSST